MVARSPGLGRREREIKEVTIIVITFMGSSYPISATIGKEANKFLALR